MKTILTFLFVLCSLSAQAAPSSFFMAGLNFAFSKQICKTSGYNCQLDPSWEQFGKEISYYKGECVDFRENTSSFFMAIFPPGTKVFPSGYKPDGSYINFAMSEERLVENIKEGYNFQSVHEDFDHYMNGDVYFTNDARFYFYIGGWGYTVVRGTKSLLALKFVRGGNPSQYCFIEPFLLDSKF